MAFPDTHPTLARALEAKGYKEPTPVQAAVLEAGGDRDLLVSAQTGSGKTVAFGLAAGPVLLGERDNFGPVGAPQMLAIAPTRELALQVASELTWLYAETGARVVTCVGGMDVRREQRALQHGCHVVVGTPGRLRDHLERGNLDISALRIVVLDEADEMLDLGFREDLEEILDATPDTRRTYLFSATIAPEIASLARRFQKDASRIDTVRRDEPHGDIEYRGVRVAPNDLQHAVVNLLRYFESPSSLVFCATREAVRRLHGVLRERGFAAVALSGEMSQKERTDALQALRDGHARVCVATDVAARGLHLPDLDLVIHADLPVNREALLHRSGRTGRAGRKGVSVLLAPHNKRRRAEQLLNAARVSAIWSGPPTADEIRERDETRFLESPILEDASTDEDIALGRRLLEGRAPEAVAAALVRLWRSRLPSPEDLFEHSTPEAPRAPRPDRDEPMNGAWFRLNIGRRKNADPKWLLPLICRLGHVTKRDIGQIRIFENETKFEIAASAEERFRQTVKATAEDDIQIEPAIAPSQGDRPARPARPPHKRSNAGPPPRSGPPSRSGPPPKGGKPPYAKSKRTRERP